MSLTRFNDKWGSPKYPPKPVAEKDLLRVEKHFAVSLPAEYRQAVLETGLPSPTIALLDAIVEHDLDLHDVSNFYVPTEIIKQTTAYRKAGMPEYLIVIADDCSGSPFCFDERELKDATQKHKAIWFFDHDFREVERVAKNFTAWIDAFCKVQPLPEEPED